MPASRRQKRVYFPLDILCSKLLFLFIYFNRKKEEKIHTTNRLNIQKKYTNTIISTQNQKHTKFKNYKLQYYYSSFNTLFFSKSLQLHLNFSKLYLNFTLAKNSFNDSSLFNNF